MSREPRPTVLATDHTSFTVADLDRSLAFWRDVMGFEVSGIVEPDPRFAADLTGLAGARARIAFVFAPGHKLELIEYRHPPGRDGPPPRPCDPGFAHVAFQVADIEAAAKKVKDAKKPVIIVNGTCLTKEGLAEAGHLSAAGVRVLTDTFFPRQARGAGTFIPDRMQYFAEAAMADLEGSDLMLIAGTQVPVAFFSYPGKPSVLVPEGCSTYIIGGPESDSAAILSALADALGAKKAAGVAPLDIPDAAPSGDLNAMTVGMSLSRHMPEGCFVSDDGVSNGLPCFLMTQRARPHDWMMLTGGAIGQGMPLALGASVAASDRKVLCLSGDGAGMYTNQALWSMARENSNVVNVVFVNHSYRILNIELARTGAGNPGPTAKSMLELGDPEIDWVKLSEAQGVPAQDAWSAEEFDAALERAFAEDGPQLIAAHVPAR